MDIHHFTVEPPGTVYAKLVLMHGLGGNGHTMQRKAGLDGIAKHGIRIYYPTAHDRNWKAQHGLNIAAGQIHRLNLMLGEGPAVPVIWGGYSDGCEMAQLCVAEAEIMADPMLAGGIFYAGHLHTVLPRGSCPVLLMRNALDKTINQQDFDLLNRTWDSAGNKVTPLTGAGDHMDLWDQSKNELITTWVLSALSQNAHYISH